LAAAQIGMMIEPTLRWETGPREFLRQYPALDGLCRWDCLLFEEIARRGYFEEKATNFFPLFPMVARVLYLTTGLEWHLALLLIANLAGLGSLVVIYALFGKLADEDAARWGITLFAVYPFSFFHATGYPETLMILSSAAAILLALRGNHIWAGTALGVGVLARHLTMFAGAALLVAQIRQRGFKPKAFLLHPAILGLAMPWLFLGGYMLFQYAVFGDALTFWKMRSNWDEYAWWGIIDLIQTSYQNEHIPIMWSYVPIALLPTVGALLLARRTQWYELAAFALVLMAVLWYTGIWGMGRYSASCWPAFLPLGVWLSKHPSWQAPSVALLAILQGMFFFLFSHGVPIL
jgi:Gpi18-like mannosyltransferase